MCSVPIFFVFVGSIHFMRVNLEVKDLSELDQVFFSFENTHSDNYFWKFKLILSSFKVNAGKLKRALSNHRVQQLHGRAERENVPR